MRVLQVVIGYHPGRAEFGGIVETVEHLSAELRGRGHDVEIWTSALLGRGRPLVDADVVAERNGVTIRYFRTWHPRRLGYGFALSPSFARAVRARVRDFDVVHVNGYRNQLALSAMSAARSSGVPYVVQTHGTIPPAVHRVRAKRLYDRLVGHRLLADADALVAISRAEALLFAEHGIDPDTVHVIYNGIDTGMTTEDLGDGTWFAETLGVAGDEILLYLGRIHERKGIQHLVPAFARVAAQRPAARLVIVGADDGYLSVIRELAAASPVAERITIEGPHYGLEKYRAMRSAALLVYPAVHEFFGLVPFEALLCGTPAVVCEGEGAAEVLDDVGGGWTVPYADPDALSGAMAKALAERAQDPSGWRRRVAAAQQAILSRYTWRLAADRVEGVYARAVAARGGRG